MRTSRIRLASGVTVLSSDDPVRVFQRFATVDALSQGRAEVILGRGSFTESFPLFGYDLKDYDKLFRGETRALREASRREAGHLAGHHTRPAGSRRCLPEDRIGPPHDLGRGRRLAAVGRPHRAIWPAAHTRDHRRPAHRFRAYVELYQRAAEQLGTTAHPVGKHSPGFIADTDEEARKCSGRTTG